jgi:hypothetical protein
MRQLAARALLLASVSCTSFDLVELPAREADVYPTAHVRSGVAVAVEEVLDARRSERYFGADLPARAILPVQVIVSNHGQGRIRVRPSDLLMLEQDRVIDPLRLDVVLTELESGERTRFGPFSVQAARRGEVW